MENAATTKDNFISKNINTLQSEIDALFIEKKEDKNKYIVDRIESQKERLLQLLDLELINDEVRHSVDDRHKGKKNDIIKEIEKQYEIIVEAIKLYLNGDVVAAISTIQKYFFINSNNNFSKNRCFYRETLRCDTIFYRTRPRKSKEHNASYTQEEMFHIPFNKRSKIGNQRYSFSGFPCLYLGKSIYVSWKETNDPKADFLDVVALKSTEDLNVLSLIIPTIGKEITAQQLKSLPLRLACSLPAAKKEDPFKPEYIIPQIILICVMKERNEGKKIKLTKTNAIYDGIQYTSTKYSGNNSASLTNYVFPVVKSKSTGRCESLTKYFTMTGTLSVNNTFKDMSSDSVVDSDRKCKFDELELKLIDLHQNKICQ